MTKTRAALFGALALQIANLVLMTRNLYAQYWFLDIIMHFWGGLVVALFIVGVLEKELSGRTGVMVVIGMTALVGIGWEVFEWTLDTFLFRESTFMGDRDDTLLDIIMDTAGGVVIAFLFLKKCMIKKS